jgi:hypothetical protein
VLQTGRCHPAILAAALRRLQVGEAGPAWVSITRKAASFLPGPQQRAKRHVADILKLAGVKACR